MAESAATPSHSMQDIQRRAANDPEARYRAFDSYPWTKDRAFTTQLAGVLHATAQVLKTDASSPSLAAAALSARIARFEQQTKIVIDASTYQDWLRANNSRPPPIVPEQLLVAESQAISDPAERHFAQLLVDLDEPLGRIALQTEPQPDTKEAEPLANAASEAISDASVLSWQAAAPKAELYIPKDAKSTDGSSGKEQYPAKFMEIVEFIQTGKPIEGIRKIPDTVIEDPSISTTGRMQAPLKPWERRATAAGNDDNTKATVGTA